jgi:hypothetical protein
VPSWPIVVVMGERNENDVLMKNVALSENNKRVRLRQYPSDHEGPYAVNIRAINTPLESKAIQKFVFENYQHVKEITHVNEHKMRVVFMNERENLLLVNGKPATTTKSAREEANDLPRQEKWNKKFRVYISAKNVEIQGLIPYAKMQSVDDFPTIAEGKFRNPLLPRLKGLEAVRLMRKSDEDETKMEQTGFVIVTFEGLALPDYVNLEGMLCPVRLFHNRKMFCENCQRPKCVTIKKL